MKTFCICVTIIISILGAAWILRPPHVPPPSDRFVRDTSRLSKAEVKEAVEKAYNSPEFLSLPGNKIKKVVVTEVRTNDTGNLFAIYGDIYINEGGIEHKLLDTISRNEFGIWSLGNVYPEHFEIREKQ